MTDTVPLDPGLVAQYRSARAQEAKWKEIADATRKVIEQLLGEHDTGTVDGQPAVRWTQVKSNRLDQTLVRSLHPAVYAECQTTTTSRRFTTVDPA